MYTESIPCGSDARPAIWLQSAPPAPRQTVPIADTAAPERAAGAIPVGFLAAALEATPRGTARDPRCPDGIVIGRYVTATDGHVLVRVTPRSRVLDEVRLLPTAAVRASLADARRVGRDSITLRAIDHLMERLDPRVAAWCEEDPPANLLAGLAAVAIPNEAAPHLVAIDLLRRAVAALRAADDGSGASSLSYDRRAVYHLSVDCTDAVVDVLVAGRVRP